jgi:putative DNA primase/helicase
MCVCKQINNKKLSVYLSKKSKSYNKIENENIYNSIKTNENITINTLYYYARLSNPSKYYILMNKKRFNKIENEGDYYDILLTNYGEDFIFIDNIIYYFNGKWWESMTMNRNKGIIKKLLSSYLKQLLKNYNNEDMEKITELMKSIKNLGKSNMLSKIYDIFIIEMELLENTTIELNENINIFCFNNACYDLEKGEQIPFNRYDYNTMTTGYDLDLTKNNTEEVDKLFNSVFLNEELRNTYISILCSGLCGQTLEKFIISNGCGRNGKGVINESIINMMGSYAYTMSSNVLLDSLKGGANPEIANLHNKRLVICKEPDNAKTLNISFIKEITGGNEINARNLYQSNTKTNLKLTLIMECNKKPNFNSRIDSALSDRLLDIPFHSYYTNDETLICPDNPNIQLLDKKLKTSKFKNDIKHSLFFYLLKYKQYANNNIYVCDEVTERTKEYLEDNDDILNIFNDFYEKTDNETDFIKLKDFYNLYKTETGIKKITLKSFKGDIIVNPFFMGMYKDRYTYHENKKKKEIRCVFIKCTIKETEEIERLDCIF